MARAKTLSLRVEAFPDVAAYLAVVEPFLVTREAEHNLLLGLAGTVRDHPEVYAGPNLFLAALGGDEVVAVASRTDPWRIVLSETDRPEAVDAFVAPSLTHGSPLPGVVGPPPPAERFARSFERATGRGARRAMAERVFRLSAVRPPQKPVGSWRMAMMDDAELIARWLVAFQAEAVPDDPPQPDALDVVRRWIAGGRWVYLWEVEDRPVSSNRIYQEIGYEPVADADAWVFDLPPTTNAAATTSS